MVVPARKKPDAPAAASAAGATPQRAAGRPLLRPTAGAQAAPPRPPPPTRPAPPAAAARPQAPPVKVESAAQEADDEILLGSVASTDARGFSLLECPDSGLSEDVRVDRSVAEPRDLAVGDAVAFKLRVSDSGRPEACAPLWKMVGFPSEEDEELEFGEHVGQLRYVSPDGHGFIECPAIQESFGREAMLEAGGMQDCGLKVGDVITFTAQTDESGTPWVKVPTWKCCSSAWAAGFGFGKDRAARRGPDARAASFPSPPPAPASRPAAARAPAPPPPPAAPARSAQLRAGATPALRPVAAPVTVPARVPARQPVPARTVPARAAEGAVGARPPSATKAPPLPPWHQPAAKRPRHDQWGD